MLTKNLSIFYIKVVVLLILLVTVHNMRANAQDSATILFKKVYNNRENIDIYDFQKTNGGYVLAGASIMQGLIIRLDKAGNILWEKKYAAVESQSIHSIQETADGGFVFAGEKWSGDGCDPASNNKDVSKAEDKQRSIYCWVGKVDSNGIMQWQTCFGEYGSYQGTCIKITSDSGYIVTTSANDARKEPSRQPGSVGIIKLDK